jgi:HEPN domain-containing protein
MPRDAILLADTAGWLKKAAGDLRAAHVGLEAEPPLLEDVVFHCQQTVEKAFKAFLTYHDQPFRKTHNLEELGEACLRLDASLAHLVDEAVPLSEYAWVFRYPGEPETPDLHECEAALSVTRGVIRPYYAGCPRRPILGLRMQAEVRPLSRPFPTLACHHYLLRADRLLSSVSRPLASLLSLGCPLARRSHG